MSERVTDPAYWLAANGCDDPDTAELIMVGLVSPTDYGVIEVRKEGRGKIVIGLVSTLVLPDAAAEAAFMEVLEACAAGRRAPKL